MNGGNNMDIGSFLCGLILMLCGISIIYKPRALDIVLRAWIDFTGLNVPIGLAFMILGAIEIWISLTPRPRKK